MATDEKKGGAATADEIDLSDLETQLESDLEKTPAAPTGKGKGKGKGAKPDSEPKAGKGKDKGKPTKPSKGKPAAAENDGARVDGEILAIPLKNVLPNPNPERDPKGKDPELTALADSLKRDGQFQPILVKMNGKGKYEIVEGDRRLKAAKKIKAKTIRAIVMDPDDDKKGIAGIITNLHRRQFSPMEEARAFKSLLDRKVFKSKAALGRAFNYTDARIHQKLGLLDLDPKLQADVDAGRVSATAAEEASKSKGKQDAVRKAVKSGKKPKVRDVKSSMSSAPVPAGELPKGAGMTAQVLAGKVRITFMVDSKNIGNDWGIHKPIQTALRKLKPGDFRKTIKRIRRQLTD